MSNAELIHKLRDACSGYPRGLVAEAADAALCDVIKDSHERRDLAALLAAWLIDDDFSCELPPVSEVTIDRILRELRRRVQ